MRFVQILIQKMAQGVPLPLPRYMTPGSSGMDVYAAEEVVIPPGEWRAIPCGFRMAIPSGYEGQIRPRSGLALKSGVTVLNSPGTIDCDYRGEVKVILINHGHQPFVALPAERIAQMVIARVERVEVCEVDEVPPSERGEGGFGHTG